jgi:hypothetical protein
MRYSPSARQSRMELIFPSDLSLARNENPSPSSHSEVIAPGLLFQYPTGPSPNPLQSDTPNRRFSLHSHSGVFMPLQIVAFSRFSAPEVHLHKMPDNLSLPAAITLKLLAADHRFKLATSCEAR